MLVEQLTHPAEDHLALVQEGGDLASKEVYDGLRHNVEGQGIARIGLDQPGVVSGAARDILFCQQVFARVSIQPGEAQGAHRCPAAL